MSIIKIENLTKRYKTKKALSNVTLEINEGELFGLLGVNGAGKTTLIKILCLLSKKTSGSVVINGLDIENDAEKIKEIIAVSPQETAIASNLTVKENLEFFANIYAKDNSKIINQLLRRHYHGPSLLRARPDGRGVEDGGEHRRLRFPFGKTALGQAALLFAQLLYDGAFRLGHAVYGGSARSARARRCDGGG